MLVSVAAVVHRRDAAIARYCGPRRRCVTRRRYAGGWRSLKEDPRCARASGLCGVWRPPKDPRSVMAICEADPGPSERCTCLPSRLSVLSGQRPIASQVPVPASFWSRRFHRALSRSRACPAHAISDIENRSSSRASPDLRLRSATLADCLTVPHSKRIGHAGCSISSA